MVCMFTQALTYLWLEMKEENRECQQAMKLEPAASLESQLDENDEMDNIVTRDGRKSAGSHCKR